MRSVHLIRSAKRRSPLLLAVAISISACTEAPPVRTVSAPRVIVAPVQRIDFEERIEVTGELLAHLETTIAAKVGGEVTEMAALEGQPIAKGDIVLEIDPHRRRLELDAARASVAQAEANLAQQRRHIERMRALQKQGVASASQLDEADLQFQLAGSQVAANRAQLEITQQALDDATVRAPFAGLTGKRYVNLGQFVQVGAPLMELVVLDPIEIVFHVAEIDSALVHPGQSVAVRVAPYPDETFTAEVIVVYPTLDAASRTQRVKATLANTDARLRPGMFARADLGIAVRKGVLVIPDEAVLLRSDGAVVFRLAADGTVERRAVELGAFRVGSVEVRSGIEVGDRVITRGQTDLIDGAVVEIVSDQGAPAAEGVRAEVDS